LGPFLQEGECFTVLATRTHKQFIWKGRHKNVVGLFAADQVVEIDEGGSVVAPTPVAGSWQSAFETVSSSQSDIDSVSSPLHISSVSPRRGQSVPTGEFRVPPMARSQSQILRSDGSAMSTSTSTASLQSVASSATRTRRRGATTTSASKFRVESNASSRPHSVDMESDNSLFLSPRDGMYISPRGGGGSSSLGIDSDAGDNEPCATNSGVFAGEMSESSIRLLIVVRNRLGALIECDDICTKLAVTLTRAGPPRHIKKLTPLLTDQQSTFVIEVERGVGTATVDVKLENVSISGSPMTI
jgi:hypothetical protein